MDSGIQGSSADVVFKATRVTTAKSWAFKLTRLERLEDPI